MLRRNGPETNFYPVTVNSRLWPWLSNLTLGVKMNQHAKYLGQSAQFKSYCPNMPYIFALSYVDLQSLKRRKHRHGNYLKGTEFHFLFTLPPAPTRDDAVLARFRNLTDTRICGRTKKYQSFIKFGFLKTRIQLHACIGLYRLIALTVSHVLLFVFLCVLSVLILCSNMPLFGLCRHVT